MGVPRWHPEATGWNLEWWGEGDHAVTLARCEVEALDLLEELYALLEPYAGDPDSDPGPELKEAYWALERFKPCLWWTTKR